MNSLLNKMKRSFYLTDSSKVLKNLAGIPKNFVPHSSCTAFIQRDSHNCGVCCLLFMIDFLLSQVDQTWQLLVSKNGILPQDIKLGTGLVDWNVLKKKFLCKCI